MKRREFLTLPAAALGGTLLYTLAREPLRLQAQTGGKALYVKPLRGFGGSGVLEIVDDFDGDTYRAVYTVRFAKAVYVLHAFQKKSKRGVATPKSELDLIEQRLKRAGEDHELWSKSEKPKSR